MEGYTPAPDWLYPKRTIEEWYSESSVSSVSTDSIASIASISSISCNSVASASSAAATGSITSGSSNPSDTGGGPSGQIAYTTEILTATISTDGSALLSTFTTTSILSTSTLGLGSQSTVNSGSNSGSNSMSTSSTSAIISRPTPSQLLVGAAQQAVCAGHGLDTQAIGVLSTLVFSAAVGLLIWLLFAILRPRVRSLYGLREWFLSPGLRPPALSNGFFAFLHPPVPLVPSLASMSDMDDARDARVNPRPNQPNADPAQLFASDEQLAQRTLWVVFLICLGWSFLALAVVLPLYLVQTPCLPNSDPQVSYGGRYGTLNDLSLLRVLRMLDNGSVNTGSTPATKRHLFFVKRLIDNGKDLSKNAYARLIALCVILIVLAILPALWKLWKEFRRLANYYQAWHEGRCERYEMAYLSCGTGHSALLGTRGGAWGWRGWGEGRVKAFFRKSGLGSGPGLGAGAGDRAALSPAERTGRRARNQPSPGSSEEKADAEINVTSVFSVGDTTRLSQLLQERDIILDNLEIAETRYINSFQSITPSPSPSLRSTVPLPAVPGSPFGEPAEEPQQSEGFLSTIFRRRSTVRPKSTATVSSDPLRDFKNQISRPQPLKGSYTRSRKGYTPVMTGPTYPPNLSSTAVGATRRGRARQGGTTVGTSTDKTPTNYLAPSSYYKLKGVQGVSAGEVASERDFANVGREDERPGGKSLLDRLTGTKFLEVNRDSTVMGKLPLGSRMAVDEHGVLNPIEPSKGPNDPIQDKLAGDTDENLAHATEEDPEMLLVDDASGIPSDTLANPSRARPRPPKSGGYAASASARETFPMRAGSNRTGTETEEEPPHLRLQARQPFHRPISGLNHDALGAIYTDIRHWRGALKAINTEITAVQEQGFEDIAEGRGIKGWILVGRGLRFLPGVQLIEGRSKEDVRWDELQRGGGAWSDVVFWTAVSMIGILLGVGLLAAAGLALATEPDVVHYLPFLTPVVRGNNVQSGLATGLAPAVAASIFVALAMFGIHKAAHQSGAVSVTVVRIKSFKAVFWVIVIVGGMWIVVAGALIFGARSLDTSSGAASSVANGSIAIALFLLLITINLAIIVPGLLLLQPIHLWRMHRREKKAITPRQHFRAIYPRIYNPIYAMGCCILGIVFVAAFCLLFPLIGPAVVILVFLSLIAHRFLIGYVYGRTDSGPTGGLLQLWIMRRFATLLALQPILLGLVILSKGKWVLGGIMIGIAFVIVLLVEWYCIKKLKKPGVDSLSPVTRDAIEAYVRSARPRGRIGGFGSGEKSSASSTEGKGKARRNGNGSISSVLDMMNVTLSVMPSNARTRPPVPLPTEHLDDLTATERAARTHPDAPPHLPPLAFVDHAEEMSSILYPPEMTAPPPVIWLPNDSAGVARSEAYDLQQYHHLATVLDVRNQADVPSPRHSHEDRRTNVRR